MSCYHPIPVWYREGHKVLFRKPEASLFSLYKPITIPCGVCIGCKLDRSKDWTGRLLMEYELNKDAFFITLTYDDVHLPKNGSLCKRDVQLFLKRLRKMFPFLTIKYFCAGEYGSTTFRPHYHLVVFGVNLFNEVFKSKKYDNSGHFKSEVLDKLWSNGFSLFSAVTPENIGYTTRYTLKKVNYKVKDRSLKKFGLIDEFLLCSKGLGFNYFLLNYDRLVSNGVYYYSGNAYPLPRYFLEKLKSISDSDFQALKSMNEKLAINYSAAYSNISLCDLESIKIQQVRDLKHKL